MGKLTAEVHQSLKPTFDNKPVLHYGVTDAFRIHTVLEEGRYVVIRLDPNHRVHN